MKVPAEQRENRAFGALKWAGYPEDTLWGYPAKNQASMRVSRLLGYQGYLISTKTLHREMKVPPASMQSGAVFVSPLESLDPRYPDTLLNTIHLEGVL